MQVQNLLVYVIFVESEKVEADKIPMQIQIVLKTSNHFR